MLPFIFFVPCVLAAENTFWKTFKARGANLGNWLILEQWMDPSFYTNHTVTGPDEWTFCKTLGSDCEGILQEHWQTWVSEDDITQLANIGYNLLRIPIGHWGLISTTSDEPYVFSNQLSHVERVLGYASNHGMQVVLDIHGLPGSQNGKDHSGHQGSVGWFTNTNVMRSLTAVSAAMRFIQSSPNAHTIAALEISNEPNITSSKQEKMYAKYIKDSRGMMNRYNSSMPLMFHDAFKGPTHWSKFTKNAKDNYVIDVHEYFNGFQSNSLSALQTICKLSTDVAAAKMTAPVFVGEFSISIGGIYQDSLSSRRALLESQISQFSTQGLAGSAFWNFKTQNADGSGNNGWSVKALISDQVITTSTWETQNRSPCPAVSKKGS